MAKNTKIQWCDHTFNPWIGCEKVAEGCKFCYAEELMANRYHRVVWGRQGVRVHTKTWADPLKWDRQAAKRCESYKVFCASLADVFEDRPELLPWRTDLFRLIDQTPHLDWLLLTKRPENISGMWKGPIRRNVWLGTSISNQNNAARYVPKLIESSWLGRFSFLSIEPQIEEVDLMPYLHHIDWVIVGGESKQGKEEARAFHFEWARQILEACGVAGVPCFVKQLGSNVWCQTGRLFLHDSHGGNMEEWPADLRVRECPEEFAGKPRIHSEVAI